MRYAFWTVDVFTDRAFGGNPLAVFPYANGLTTEQMQLIAREFNLSETAFVLAGRIARAHLPTPHLYTRGRASVRGTSHHRYRLRAGIVRSRRIEERANTHRAGRKGRAGPGRNSFGVGPACLHATHHRETPRVGTESAALRNGGGHALARPDRRTRRRARRAAGDLVRDAVLVRAAQVARCGSPCAAQLGMGESVPRGRLGPADLRLLVRRRDQRSDRPRPRLHPLRRGRRGPCHGLGGQRTRGLSCKARTP